MEERIKDLEKDIIKFTYEFELLEKRFDEHEQNIFKYIELINTYNNQNNNTLRDITKRIEKIEDSLMSIIKRNKLKV